MSKRSTLSATSTGRGLDRVFVGFALSGLAAQAVLGPHATPVANNVVTGVGIATSALAVRFGGAHAAASAILVACVGLGMRTGLPWQPALLAALVLFFVLGRWALPGRLSDARWRARGTFPWWPTALVGGITPGALVAWLLLVKPDLHDVIDGYVPALPLPLLVLGALGFVVVNATLEEIVWRGLLQEQLTHVFGATAAVGIQAASFGVQHAWGFPRGVSGVALAGSWAVMLGLLRRRSGGLLAPIAAHLIADATIAVLVLFVVR